MAHFFEFSNRENVESTMKKIWGDFRATFIRGNLQYDEVDKVKKITFLKILHISASSEHLFRNACLYVAGFMSGCLRIYCPDKPEYAINYSFICFFR
jgi:hypothetical protein